MGGGTHTKAEEMGPLGLERGWMGLTRPTCQLAHPPQNIRAWNKSQHQTPLQATSTSIGEQAGECITFNQACPGSLGQHQVY